MIRLCCVVLKISEVQIVLAPEVILSILGIIQIILKLQFKICFALAVQIHLVFVVKFNLLVL